MICSWAVRSPSTRPSFGLFTLPLLIIHGTKDTVTRPEGSQEFYAKASSKDKTLKLYEGYFHDPLSDIGKEAVMADIRSWIGAHLPA
jgi:alpha-beta hydrolase superfamily lysophospholipase